MKGYEKYLGKVLTLEEMIKLFPDKWVVVNKGTFSQGQFIKGELMAVCKDEELQGVLENTIKTSSIRPYWTRTTEDFTDMG